ncbi:MAG: DUF4437 domain-containing protein [Litoreibacter sp.]|uniref:cupin domain-containing protein n=1 Tax=Litoreibacter sp. TaxID=1969459 RepID=UPI00329A6550
MRFPLLGLATLITLPAFAEPQITNLPTSQLDWQTTPEGVAFAALEGNRFESAYMAMVRLPAGLASPPHVKTANMFGIVVEGEMTHVAHVNPQTAPVLSAGAFYKIPKDLPHVSSCVSDVPCVAFLYQDGQFDFLPVGQP